MALKMVKGSIDRMFDKNLQDLVRGIRNHKEDEVSGRGAGPPGRPGVALPAPAPFPSGLRESRGASARRPPASAGPRRPRRLEQTLPRTARGSAPP